MSYRIRQMVLGACQTNVYLVSDPLGETVLIDPADDAEQIIRVIEEQKLKLRYIFITHGHTDHILALEKVRNYFHVPAVISEKDAYRLEDELLINERPYVTVPYRKVRPDILISGGDVIRTGELEFSFYEMPGHTEGSVAVILEDVIFSGDTLLYEDHGKTSLPGGNEELLTESINRMVRELKGDYRVLPGHGRETTLDHERKWNPYVDRKNEAASEKMVADVFEEEQKMSSAESSEQVPVSDSEAAVSPAGEQKIS